MLVMIGVYGNTALSRNVLQDKASGYDTYARQLCTSVRLVTADLEQNFFHLYQNASLAESLESGQAQSSKTLEVEQRLRSICHNNSYFTSMVAMDIVGNAYFGTISVTERPEPMLALVRSAMEEMNEFFTLWQLGRDGDVYLKKNVYKLSPLRVTGLLVGRLDSNQLLSTLGLDSSIDGKAGILTPQGKRLLDVGGFTDQEVRLIQEAVGPGSQPVSQKLSISGIEYWLTVYTDSRFGWRVLHLVPLSQMLRVSMAVAQAGVIGGLISAIAALLLGILMTHSVTRNVKKLLGAMTDVSDGNFDVAIHVRSRDEIGQLSDRFRWMLGRLRESTAQMVQRATEKQQAEYALLELKYRSLQSQISPHFICNILSSINSLALMGKTKEVSKLSISASQYLRDNMGGAEMKFTSLRTEIRYLEEYVSIYRAVYGDGNLLELDVPEELLESRVPNMLLQPLGENALVHGGGVEKHLIRVAARRQGTRLRLAVMDNGGSISPDVIEDIRKANADHQHPTKKMKGFGLRSVLQRLRYLYGDDQSLEIQCEPGKESRILIDIPWQSYALEEE